MTLTHQDLPGLFPPRPILPAAYELIRYDLPTGEAIYEAYHADGQRIFRAVHECASDRMAARYRDEIAALRDDAQRARRAAIRLSV